MIKFQFYTMKQARAIAKKFNAEHSITQKGVWQYCPVMDPFRVSKNKYILITTEAVTNCATFETYYHVYLGNKKYKASSIEEGLIGIICSLIRRLTKNDSSK